MSAREARSITPAISARKRSRPKRPAFSRALRVELSLSKRSIAAARPAAVCSANSTPGAPVEDGLAGPADAVGDHRQPGRLRLDGHDPEVLLAGEQQRARAAQQPVALVVGDLAEELGALVRPARAPPSSARPPPATFSRRPSRAHAATARSTRL